MAENKTEKEKVITPEVVGEISKDDKTMAMLAHILGLPTQFIAPLIIYLIKKDESEFIATNAKEALNFQITFIILWFIAALSTMIFIGIALIPILIILDIVFCIQGATAANNGKIYRYPLCFRFIQ